MAHVPILRGHMVKGKIQWRGLDGKKLAAISKHLDGCDVEVTIQKERRQRSLKQNSYYHGVVVAMIAEAAGYEHDEAHDALREKFLRKHGESQLPTIRSTTELTTVEWEEYMRQCRHLAVEMWGLYIPDPSEVLQEVA